MLVLTLISVLIITIFLYFRNVYSYWKRKGVPYIEPTFPLGSIDLSFAKTAQKSLQSMYEKFKSNGAKFGGLYMTTNRTFMPIHPDIIKSILIKNFDNFMDRGIYYDETLDPLLAHLFALSGTKWASMRKKLSPTFTSGKIKMMFPTLVACTKDIKTVLEKAEGDALDLKELAATFSTDVIANCAFGLECNSIRDPATEFRKYGRMFLENSFIDKIKLTTAFIKPSVLQFFRIPVLKPIVTKYFTSVVKETIRYREENDVHRKDFLDLLIRLKNNENISDDAFFSSSPSNQKKFEETDKKDGFTAAEIAAQAFVFYVAGFETSSTTMTNCLMELAKNQEIQDKVRDEINSVIEKCGGELTYDGIMEMHYLDKVINETLRIHPAVFMLVRVCTKDIKIENTDVVLEKGTRVIIPLLALHSDPDYYPNPEIFDPERFSTENTSKRPPFTYLPFGEGPRFCIGMRFGMLQTKVGVISFLRNYKYSIHEKTKLPISYVSNLAILSTEDKVYFKIKRV